MHRRNGRHYSGDSDAASTPSREVRNQPDVRCENRPARLIHSTFRIKLRRNAERSIDSSVSSERNNRAPFLARQYVLGKIIDVLKLVIFYD